MAEQRQAPRKPADSGREVDPRFRVIFEQSPIGIILYDSDGRITTINPSALAMFGIAREEEALDIPLFQEPNLPPGVAERLKAGESVRLTVPYDFGSVRERAFYPTSRTGVIILEGHFTPLGAAGQSAGFLLQVQDVTAATIDRSTRETALRDAERLRRETAGLLAGARAVLVSQDFTTTAKRLFEVCKELLGADAGYIALLSADGVRNELVFLDPGGLPCVVDPALPMPIRGLREESYRTGRPAWENDFAGSVHAAWLPPGHAPLHNVLFAPLVIGGATVGILGLANKPGGFQEPDATLAAAFGELAAIALMNSRSAQQIERSLREKDVLLREIHHRVKNNLQVVISLLTLQGERLHDEQARQVFQESMDRIRSMALIHERLLTTGDLGCIRMQDYFAELLVHLMQSYGAGPDQVRTEVHAGDHALDIDSAVTCGLIVNELVSNSLKHAFPRGRKGMISVSLERRELGAMALRVSDDGVGFPAERAPSHGGTTGIQLLRVLCEQLGGAAELSGERGMRFQVVFTPRG
jgi:PAS domain S-box-containing protein